MLFLAFALNSLGDANLNLLLITIVVVAVICLELALCGMYKAWSLNILDALILMNLVALSSLTWYVQTDGQFDVTVPLLSVMKHYNYVYVVPLSEHRYAGEGLLQRLQIRVAELLPMPGCQEILIQNFRIWKLRQQCRNSKSTTCNHMRINSNKCSTVSTPGPESICAMSTVQVARLFSLISHAPSKSSKYSEVGRWGYNVPSFSVHALLLLLC